MKICPFCSEEIQDAAIKCKHCGSEVKIKLTKEQEILGLKIFLILVVIFILLIFFIVSCTPKNESSAGTTSSIDTSQEHENQEIIRKADEYYTSCMQNLLIAKTAKQKQKMTDACDSWKVGMLGKIAGDQYIKSHEFTLTDECKTAIKRQMNDPKSADFSFLGFWAVWNTITYKATLTGKNLLWGKNTATAVCKWTLTNWKIGSALASIEE